MPDTYYYCEDCGRDDVVNAVEGITPDYWFCEDCYYQRENLEMEIDKARDMLAILRADNESANSNNACCDEIKQLKAENEELLEENQNLKVQCYKGCDTFIDNERLKSQIASIYDSGRRDGRAEIAEARDASCRCMELFIENKRLKDKLEGEL